MADSLSRFVVALARRSRAVNVFLGLHPFSFPRSWFAANLRGRTAMSLPMRRTIPANCRKAAGLIQIEIGVTNRIRTGTNAFTGRDAAVTS